MALSAKNRWFHRPRLHGDTSGAERRATALELLYDVLVAGTFVVLGDALSQHPNTDGFAVFGLALTAAFQSWTGFTFYENRFAVDDLIHRLLVLGNLFAVGVLAVQASRVVQGDLGGFSATYACIELILFLLYLRTLRAVPDARKLVRYYSIVYAINACVWGLAAVVPRQWTTPLWIAGVGLGFSFPLNRRSRELAVQHPPDPRHTAERYGFFTLALLGESYVRVVLDAASSGERSTIIAVGLALVVTFCLWWLYFDDLSDSTIHAQTGAAFVWVYSHFPLVFGLTILGAGVNRTVSSDPAVSVPATRWLIGGGLSLALVALALIDSVTERRQADLTDRIRVNARIGFAVLALLLVPLGAAIQGPWFLALPASLCVSGVVFDLMMAPIDGRTFSMSAPTTAELAKERLFGETGAVTKRPRARPGDALRKGAPSELRQDFYSFFMEGSWSRLLLSLIFLYVALNVFFAGLYLVEPGSITNARTDSFSDAFFFSVQTFSTIGYGAMLPATAYGNWVVTAEACVALLGAALATGIMFAKAARPRSSALFSKTLILTRYDGRPSLVFRVANARGNDVVDATISVTVLKEEISREGHHMRRQHDLALLRSRTPFFTLTWTVIHPIDEKSPLREVDWSNTKDVLALVCTLTGHDGTYGQMTYARQIYFPEDVRVGHRFVDVLSELDDGRLLIDYSKFHDTVPEETAPGPTSSP